MREVNRWTRYCLDKTGRYYGLDLSHWGAPLKPGEYVPVDKRYSRMAEMSYALRARRLAGESPYRPNDPMPWDNETYD